MKENLTVKWYKTVDSTNMQAEREKTESKDKTVWAAEFQTAGRGQRGNKWEAESGKNLTFSILFKPRNILATEQFNISKAVSLGVCAYLKENGADAEIKWPNDIYIGDKKICGMLIENSVDADKLSSSIVGIGINLNQRKFTSNASNPTSLSLVKFNNVTEKNADMFDLRAELSKALKNIFYYYDKFSKNGNGLREIDNEYFQLLYRKDGFYLYEEMGEEFSLQPNTFITDTEKRCDNRIEARIVDIDNNGRLVLEDKNGLRKAYAFKEIRYIL